MSHTTCANCGHDVAPGIVLCARCTTTLDRSLGNIATYYADLDTIRQKRTRYGTAAGKGSVGKQQPLPVDMRFLDHAGVGSQVVWDTKNTLTTWARIILDEWRPADGPACRNCLHLSCSELRRRTVPRNHIGAICAFIQGHLHGIVGVPWAGELMDESLDVEARLRRFVDRPAERQFVGVCSADEDDPNGPCTAELYVKPDAEMVTCEACGFEHKVNDRRDFLLQQAREVTVTASEAAGALCAWTDYDGSPVKLVDLIRKWATRTETRAARILPTGHIEHLGRERALYRLGDIEVLLRKHVQERSLKSTA